MSETAVNITVDPATVNKIVTSQLQAAVAASLGKSGVCAYCGGAGPLKRGWTCAMYCSKACEWRAVSDLHNSMPGGPNPHAGWLPNHIAAEITRRWAKTEGCER